MRPRKSAFLSGVCPAMECFNGAAALRPRK